MDVCVDEAREHKGRDGLGVLGPVVRADVDDPAVRDVERGGLDAGREHDTGRSDYHGAHATNITGPLPRACRRVPARRLGPGAGRQILTRRTRSASPSYPRFRCRAWSRARDRTRTLDIPAMVWLLKGPNGRQVLVDSGFYRQKFLDQWKPRDFRSPAAAVEAAGVAPAAVTDIIISHAHWDHVDGADLFPKATVWIQREEYRYYMGEAWQARNTHGGVDADDMQALLKINTEGRLKFVEGDDQEIIPGIRCYTGGKHTFASQYVTARTAEGTIVLASDNVYLYENLEKHVPIAQTLDAASNLKAQDRIRTLASDPRLIGPRPRAARVREVSTRGGRYRPHQVDGPMTKLRWGLLSTARINRLVIPAIRSASRSTLTTVASRTTARAAAYAAEWDIPHAAGPYDALLADPAVDVVYISLPNSLHAEWTIRALEAGKHVLCEKPLALSVADVDRIAAAATRAGRVAAEAFMYRHHPLTHAAEAVVRSGRLGAIRGFKGAFTFPLTREGDVRLDPALGGGSLWDVGCYPVSYACLLAGAAPLDVFGWQQTASYRCGRRVRRHDAISGRQHRAIRQRVHGSLAFRDGGHRDKRCAAHRASLPDRRGQPAAPDDRR